MPVTDIATLHAPRLYKQHRTFPYVCVYACDDVGRCMRLLSKRKKRPKTRRNSTLHAQPNAPTVRKQALRILFMSLNDLSA